MNLNESEVGFLFWWFYTTTNLIKLSDDNDPQWHETFHKLKRLSKEMYGKED